MEISLHLLLNEDVPSRRCSSFLHHRETRGREPIIAAHRQERNSSTCWNKRWSPVGGKNFKLDVGCTNEDIAPKTTR